MDQFKNNCYLLDYGEYGPNYRRGEMKKTIVGSHPNAVGYTEAAYYYNTLIDYVISKNFDKFQQTAFIGTEKKYDPIDD
jgi:hypothetical protein